MDRVCAKIVDQYGGAYPELTREKEHICRNIKAEEETFHATLVKGLRRFNEMVGNAGEQKVMDGELVFRLYDTFGFPVELTAELAAEKGLTVDMEDFQNRFRTHQEKSRAGSEQTFKGGLADNSEETTKLHTATHLLNAALRELIDPNIRQKGSNITADRLRFDFNFDRKLTPEELKSIEAFVNDAIQRNIPVVCEEMPVDEAKASGAIGVFDDKYGAIVKVYRIGDVSAELCGGPHVANTGDIQGFKIKKEESSAAGVRRIKAVVGKF
ncbi:MAG: alanine--tRNA ligase, partial [Candidatus Methanomethylophilaceae archaeon]|nr:alanine--tRNA ligase [Candidatus Methanomethylophilaceae archaeon]